jgi:effector-binding domain-containing protein
MTAVIPLTVVQSELPKVMGPAIGELMAALAAQGIAPAGPVFAHYVKMGSDVYAFEVGVPVSAPVAPTGRLRLGQLPAARVARAIYYGRYEGLPAAWGEFAALVSGQGHRPAAGLWECYLVGPESSPDPANWRTELNQPLLG